MKAIKDGRRNFIRYMQYKFSTCMQICGAILLPVKKWNVIRYCEAFIIFFNLLFFKDSLNWFFSRSTHFLSEYEETIMQNTKLQSYKFYIMNLFENSEINITKKIHLCWWKEMFYSQKAIRQKLSYFFPFMSDSSASPRPTLKNIFY